jgi:two-component system sensor histidine kinase RpfC
MGGTVAVESEVGRGSLFTVSLPLELDRGGDRHTVDLLHRRLVVVSDDAVVAEEIAATLRSWRGNVEMLRFAEATPERVRGRGRPIVLVDGRGNPIGGLSACHRLAPGLAAAEPLLVFIADAASADYVAGLAETQVAAVLAAPVDVRHLANALRALPAAVPDEGETDDAALPRAATRAPASGDAGATAARRPLKILLAEDNAANRKIIRRILDMAGHEVCLARNGEEALAVLDELPVDLVLMDINMPEMSGYEATKLYRMAHLDGRRLPIIALTADATNETARLCREAGMDAVLTKPIDASQLLAAVEGVVSGTMGGPSGHVVPPAVVTPIAAHPRFVPEGTSVEEAALDALRALGAGSDFFVDVIQAFRADARDVLEQLKTAVAAGDLRAVKEHAHSLRSSAANVGGIRLCDALLAMRDLSAKDLRQDGAAHLEKVVSEFAKLDAALDQRLRDAKAG